MRKLMREGREVVYLNGHSKDTLHERPLRLLFFFDLSAWRFAQAGYRASEFRLDTDRTIEDLSWDPYFHFQGASHFRDIPAPLARLLRSIVGRRSTRVPVDYLTFKPDWEHSRGTTTDSGQYTFVELKTNTSQLSGRETQAMKAILKAGYCFQKARVSLPIPSAEIQMVDYNIEHDNRLENDLGETDTPPDTPSIDILR
jgi:hypothetical protein